MQISLTLLVQLCNGIISIIVVKHWLVIPYLKYYNNQRRVVDELALKTDALNTAAKQNAYQRQIVLTDFQQHILLLINQRQQNQQTLANQNLIAMKQTPEKQPPEVSWPKPDLSKDVVKIIELINDNP